MRVLFITITYGLNGETDGVAVGLRHLVGELDKHGVQTSVLAYGPQSKTYQDPTRGDSEIISHKPLLPIKVDQMPYFTDPLFGLSSTAKYLSGRKFDVIISSTPDFLGRWAFSYTKHHKVKFIGFHQTDVSGQIAFRLGSLGAKRLGETLAQVAQHFVKKYWEQTDLLLFPSSYLAKHLNCEHNKIAILTLGIDTVHFRPLLHKTAASPYSLFVGRLEAEKGLHMLMDIFKNKQESLHVVGSGSMLRSLQQAMPNTTFYGKLVGESLLKIYQNATCFVFPSVWDSFGLVVLEALSCGIPVVAFDKGGHVEMIEHGKNGFLAKNQEEFTTYVSMLLEDAALAKDMGINARNSALKYSWESTGQRLRDLL